MKCPKCGAEVSEKDKFCEECGTALQSKETEPKAVTESNGCSETKSISDKSVDTKRVIEPKNTVKSKKKGIMIGVICAAVVLIVGVVIATFGSSEYNFEAKELAEMIAADTEATYNKYEGDTLHVHGYFYSDGLSDHWALYSDKDADLENVGLEDIVLFSPTDEVTGKLNEIGNGSEITITGTLSSLDQDMTMLVLDAQTVEILNAEERTYNVDSVAELLENADQYINQTVTVAGLVDRSSADVIFMTDNGSASESYVLMKNVESVYPNFLLNAPYGVYNATGKFYLDKGNAALQLTELSLVSEVDSVTEFNSVDDLIRSAVDHEGEIIKVTGIFDGASENYWLWNEEQSDTVGLEDIQGFDVYSVGGFPWITVEGKLLINEYGHPTIDITNVY